MISRVFLIPTVFALLFFSGCSIDYGAALSDEGIEEDIPNTIIEGLSFVSVRRGKPVLEMEAEKALAYNKKKETHLQGVSFNEYTTAGEIAASGSGDFGIYYQETEDVDMEGNLELYSRLEEAGILAQSLSWHKDTKTLEGRPGELVRVEKDDGSYIQGKEFLGKIGEKTFEFGTASSGLMKVSEEEDEKE